MSAAPSVQTDLYVEAARRRVLATRLTLERLASELPALTRRRVEASIVALTEAYDLLGAAER